MSEPKHTPDCSCHLSTVGGKTVWQFCPMHTAAPDLLEACRRLVEVACLVPVFQIGDGQRALEQGVAAIAKATPEEKGGGYNI